MKKETKIVKKLKGLLKQLNQREYLHNFCPKKFKFVQHVFAFDGRHFELKIQTIIKLRKNIKKGFYRREHSDKEYHQRSLIEAGFGSLKRKYGGSVSGKSWRSINSEIYLKPIAHNLNLVC